MDEYRANEVAAIALPTRPAGRAIEQCCGNLNGRFAMRHRLQFSILDALLLTAIVGGVTGAIAARQAAIAFLTAAGVLLFVLRRPVLLRLWTTAVVGTGGGMLVAMFYKGMFYEHRTHEYDFGMMSEELAGWGAGLFIGGVIACRLFILHPPAENLSTGSETNEDSEH